MATAPARCYPPPSGPSAVLSPPASRTNRLRRSLRSPAGPAAAGSPRYRETAHLNNKQGGSPPPAEFKTPTRVPRSKYTASFCGGGVLESPNNDGDLTQDIVWDAASPSPVRAGKRGKSRAAGAAIGISEIVRRIAPMHGRPEVVEPTLQEWIGDSAAIPCTPEVQHPKAKKKSPRPNGVDDLLKLAKQFDFNMFQQDEEQAEDLQQQTLELLSGDILNCENGFQEGPQRTLVEASPAATETATEDASPARVLQDHNMEDDLELLFDEPTQHISENLSQYGLFGSMETSSFNSMAAPGPTRCPTPAVSTHAKDSPAGNRLDDDWENDDFLNDSLVIEMTQNPLNFAPPKHCSTQRGSDVTLHGRKYPSRGTPGKLGGVAQNEPRIPKNRTTFKLDANPQFSLPTVVTGTATNQASVSNASTHTVYVTPQGEALSRRNRPVSGSQLKRHSQPSGEDVSNARTVPQSQTSLTDGSAQRNSAVTAPPIPSNTMKENQPVRSSNIQATINPSAVHKERQTLPVALASDDFLDEDLDDFFSTEPVWDDEGDDDLLCKMCDDLESQAEAPGQTSQRPTPLAASAKVGDNRKGHLDVNVLKDTWPSTPPTTAAAQAAGHLRSLPEHVTPTPLAAQPARPSVDSFAGNTLSNIKATRMDSHRYGPPEQSSCRVSNVGNSQCYGGGPSLKTRAGDEGQFTFKKPPGPSVRVINTGPEKCSMAEIERKKRQAVERRRQRLQATQSLRAPT